MVFWLAILAGALFAWIAIRIGFYETWALLFNILISIYVAILLTPLVVNAVPAAANTAYGIALTLVAIAVGTFLLLHGISYTFLTGQFSVSFPKIFETVLAGVLGFLAGFLVSSFAAFLICVTPISQNKSVKGVGLGRQSQQANISYTCWSCDLVHGLVRSRDDKITSQHAVDELLTAAQSKVKPKKAPVEPNEMVEQTE